MIKKMVVNVWDEVCGDKLTLSNNQRYVLEMWRAEDDKLREYQLLVGRQDSDLSKITVMWPVSEECTMIADSLLIIGPWFIEDKQIKSMISEPE
jgi:hypothetical protein